MWHDDQQGRAAIILAALIDALENVGKRMVDIRVALVGVGAVSVVTLPLLLASGVGSERVVACDSTGFFTKKGKVSKSERMSSQRRCGCASIATPRDGWGREPLVTRANPIPEIWHGGAKAAGAI